MKKPRFVYFLKPVGMDGPVKIGCSDVPENRLDQLGVWSPFPLELIGHVPGCMADEQFLHDCFAELHSHNFGDLGFGWRDGPYVYQSPTHWRLPPTPPVEGG